MNETILLETKGGEWYTVQISSVLIDGENLTNVKYHKAGATVASSCWVKDREEAEQFLETLVLKTGASK